MTLTNKPNLTLVIGLPLLIFVACIVIASTSAFGLHIDRLSTAITLDLTITAPLLYYFLIRNTTVPKITVVRVFVAGMVIAGLLLRNRPHFLLNTLHTWIAPVIESVVIFVIARKFYLANKALRQNKSGSIDFMLHCRGVMKEIIGNEKAANILSGEIAVLYYAFFGGSNKAVDEYTTFSYHRKNGIILVLGTFLGLFLVETTGVHFLIHTWSAKAAWIVSTLSLYTCVQLYAHIRAIKARPIRLAENSIQIKNGLAADAHISLSNIARIELTSRQVAGKEAVHTALIKAFEKHNVALHLKHAVTVTKFFGIQKQASVVLLFVDSPAKFIAAVTLHKAANE